MGYARIRPKRGTAIQWTSANTVLAEGEWGVEVPTDGVGSGLVNIKIGDGSTAWNDLPYAYKAYKPANNLTTEAEGFFLDARQGKELQDQITQQNSNALFKNKVHSLNKEYNINASTGYAYTGVSITIPANSIFSVTVEGVFANSQCTWIGISDSSSANASYVNANAGLSHASASVSQYTSTEKNLYIWGKWATANKNSVKVFGYYIELN